MDSVPYRIHLLSGKQDWAFIDTMVYEIVCPICGI